MWWIRCGPSLVDCFSNAINCALNKRKIAKVKVLPLPCLDWEPMEGGGGGGGGKLRILNEGTNLVFKKDRKLFHK